jgi:hypothetical protein
MKKRTLLIVIVAVALVVLTTTSVALAKPPRMLTGSVYFYVSDWGGVKIWNTYFIEETNPTTGAAKGSIWVTVFDPANGWKSLVFVPECVKFKEHSVTIVTRVAHKIGVGNGEVGEHAKWQMYDGGYPGRAKDTLTLKNYQDDPWIEYWPVGVPAPDCTPIEPGTGSTIFVTAGNLTIR